MGSGFSIDRPRKRRLHRQPVMYGPQVLNRQRITGILLPKHTEHETAQRAEQIDEAHLKQLIGRTVKVSYSVDEKRGRSITGTLVRTSYKRVFIRSKSGKIYRVLIAKTRKFIVI